MIRKIIITFVLIGFLFVNVKADELKVGTSFLKMNYVETGRSGKFLDSETSLFTDIDGFNISYRKDIGRLGSNGQLNSIEVSLRQLKGTSAYDGFLQSSSGAIIRPYKTTTQNKIFEPKLRLMRTKYTHNYDIGMFVSVGNREWTRDMSSDPYGIKEIYDWKYYDFGIKTVFYDDYWELGLELAFQKAINPTMNAYMNPILNFDLGDVRGYYYKTAIGYNFDKNLKLELEYEYNEWKIDASNIVRGYYEPDSTTKNKIISLNIVYKF